MNASRFASAFLLLLSGCASSHIAAPPTSPTNVTGRVSLTVRLIGLETADAAVAVAIYDSAQSFDARTNPVASARLTVVDGSATWRLFDLDPGIYAIAAYHDRNDNGELDRSALGLPSEPYGFSNDARGRLGPPRFQAAAVVLQSRRTELEIPLR